MSENALISKFNDILNMISVYFSDKDKWDIKLYLQKIENFYLELLKISLPDDLPSEISEIFKSDLCSLQADFRQSDDPEDKKVLAITHFVYHYHACINKMDVYSEVCEEQITQLKGEVEEYLFDNESKKVQGYYVNLIDEQYHNEFKQILNLLKNELKNYDMNLEYSKKIVAFINDEFSKHGVFPTELLFLKQFLNNAVDSMILVVSKLYFDACDIGKKKNCGIRYLQSFLNKRLKEEVSGMRKDYLQGILSEVGPIIKQVQSLAPEVEEIRNTLIAHYDIKKEEDIKEIKIEIGKFDTIRNLSAKIFELLSLKFFDRETKFAFEMINIHGFKSFVMQNVWIHNQNGKMDLDLFLDTLRKDFIENLIIKDKKVNDSQL